MYKPHHEIWIEVSRTGALHFEVLLHSADSPESYHFANWGHMLAHFGSILPLIECPIRIRAGFNRSDI